MNESAMGTLSSALPQLMQESGKDIRIFLPRFGRLPHNFYQLGYLPARKAAKIKPIVALRDK